MKTPTMRAVRLDVHTGDVAVETVRRPRPGTGQVLVRVEAAGVGRADVELVAGHGPVRPDALGRRTLGREVAGVMAAPGAGVDGWPLGRRVVLRSSVLLRRGSLSLGVDHDGGLADYVVAPVEALIAIPDTLEFEHAAVLDVVATAWSALTRTGDVRPGEAVGIWGVGALGTHAVQLARLIGAAPVVAIDPLPAARDRALSLGADAALDPGATAFDHELRAANGGRALDLALHMADSDSADGQVSSSLASGGRAVLVGAGVRASVPVGGTEFWRQGKRLLGDSGPRPEDIPLVLRLIAHGRLDLAASVTEVLPLEAAGSALRRVAEHDGRTVRLVVSPRISVVSVPTD